MHRNERPERIGSAGRIAWEAVEKLGNIPLSQIGHGSGYGIASYVRNY